MKFYVVPENDSAWAKAKAWCKNRATDVAEFYEDNKLLCWTCIPLLIKGGFDIWKSVNRHGNLELETKIKELFVYDNKLGHYWELRRKLTNDEWLMVQTRQKAGERIGDILDEMRVLK
jgi:hypothetical protein